MRAALKINSLCLLLLLTEAGAPDSPVADAAMRGDIEEVRELLRTGADVNAAQGDGMTALHWAADNGDAGIAQILVYAGASLESITRLGSFTPLMVASREGNTDVIAALLGAGAKVDAVTETGERAIHLAAYAGSAEAVSLLSAHGADTNARELSSGQTPLMFAAAYGRADVVRVLMESGADPTLETWVVDYPAMAEEDKVLIAERDTRLSALFGEDIVSETPVDGTEVDYDEEAETEDDEAETIPEAPLRQIAEAIAGELRKVGIRATVRAMPLPVYTKRRGRGELTALLARYPTFAQPNTANLMNFFFGSNRDYSKDPVIQGARKAGLGEMDLKKRTAIYQKAMDQVNKMSYIYPFGEQPNVYVHAKSVEIKKGLFSSTETRPTDYFWK